jgi:hypothetical protein
MPHYKIKKSPSVKGDTGQFFRDAATYASASRIPCQPLLSSYTPPLFQLFLTP